MVATPMEDIAILFATATAVVTILHRIKFPEVVGLILAGTIVGPYGLQWVAELQSAEVLTELGMVLLLFTIGLEITPDRLALMRRSFFRWGPWQVCGSILLTWLLARYVGSFTGIQAFYIGCLVSLSSTAIITKLIEESRAETHPHANAILGILIFQDIAVIFMLILLPLFAISGDLSLYTVSWGAVLAWLGRLVGVVVLFEVTVKWVLPHVFKAVLATRSKGIFYFLVLSLCFGAAGLFHAAGFSASLGAFVLGLALNRSTYRFQLVAELSLVKENLLNLFFISLGMLLDVRFVMDHIVEVLAIVVLMTLVKFIAIYTGGRFLVYSRQLSWQVGIALAHVGEFAFVLANEGAKLKILSGDGFQYFLSASLISLLFAPFIYRFCFLRPQPGSSATESTTGAWQEELEGHQHAPDVVIIGYGLAGRSLSHALAELNLRYRIVEMNYDAVKRLVDNGEDAVFGDASRHEVLERVVEGAKLVVVTANGVNNLQRIVLNVRQVAPGARIVVRLQYMAEAHRLNLPDGVEVVIAEYETSVEILMRVLRSLQVDQGLIDAAVMRSKSMVVESLPRGVSGVTTFGKIT